MSYTVFARKYRPQTFDDVVGQEHITRTLKNAIEQRRLAHAYIFVGPRGTGKTSTARILAKSLNCQRSDGPTTQPCGECDSCREIAGGNSLDVLEFDAASNTQVDKVRELIIDNVKYAPTRGRYKVYIVDEVHMLSASSFNALLKTLEEPPGHVKFVFATTDVQKVPTTILSRCQRFDLKRIPEPLISAHILQIAGKEKLKLSADAAAAIAHGAEGGMRDAESMLDQLVAFCGETIEETDVLSIFGLTAHQTVLELAERIISGETPAALSMIHEQAEAGRDLTRLMGDLIGHFRNLLVAQADPTSLHGEQSEEEVSELVEQASRVKAGKLLELIEQFAGAESRMRWAPNRKMHFEIAVIRAIQTLGQATLTDVLDTLSAMRNGGAPPVIDAPGARVKQQMPAKPVRPTPAKKAEETSPPVKVEPPPQEVPSTISANNVPQEEVVVVANVQEEAAPVAMGSVPEPALVAEPEEQHSTVASSLSLKERWPEVLAEVRKSRPLIVMWVEAGTLLEVENGVALIGFPPEQALAAEYCQQANNRTFLEEVISALGGETLTLKTRVKEGLAISRPAAREPEPAADPMAEFKNDPLIRRALEIFRAQIQPA